MTNLKVECVKVHLRSIALWDLLVYVCPWPLHCSHDATSESTWHPVDLPSLVSCSGLTFWFDACGLFSLVNHSNFFFPILCTVVLMEVYVCVCFKKHPYFSKKKLLYFNFAVKEGNACDIVVTYILLFSRCCDSCHVKNDGTINMTTRFIFLYSDCHCAPFFT
jgi:hypothetical protein